MFRIHTGWQTLKTELMRKITTLLIFILIIKSSILNAQVTDLVTGLTQPSGLALNSNELYYVEQFGNTIFKIDISISNPTPVPVFTGIVGSVSLAFKGNELYISTEITGEINKIDISQSNPSVVLVA